MYFSRAIKMMFMLAVLTPCWASYVDSEGVAHRTKEDSYYRHLVIYLNNLTQVNCRVTADPLPEWVQTHGVLVEGTIGGTIAAGHHHHFEMTTGNFGTPYSQPDVTVTVKCKKLGWIKLRTWKKGYWLHALAGQAELPRGEVVERSPGCQLHVRTHGAKNGAAYLAQTKGAINWDISDDPEDLD